MIEGHIGDITEKSERGELLVHCVNCQGAMGAGLARTIRHKWPEVYSDYLRHVNRYKDKSKLLGTVQHIITEKTIVSNLFGQLDYGTGRRFVSYDALDAGFHAIAEEFSGMPERMTVNFPMIGCGLAGGDWRIVSQIIEARLPDEDFKKKLWSLEGELFDEQQLP